MLHDYSQMVPFTEAVSMTFSGQYPCAICKAIAEKKQSENDKICSLEKFEKKFFPPVSITLVRPTAVSFQYTDYLNSLQARSEAPPTPPPRPALALTIVGPFATANRSCLEQPGRTCAVAPRSFPYEEFQMKNIIQGAALICATIIVITPALVQAHGFEGNRFFPAHRYHRRPIRHRMNWLCRRFNITPPRSAAKPTSAGVSPRRFSPSSR